MKWLFTLYICFFFITNISLLAQSACPDGPSNRYKDLAQENRGTGNIDAQAYSQAAMYEIAVCACTSGELSPQATVDGLKARANMAKSKAQELKSGLTFRSWPNRCTFRNESAGSSNAGPRSAASYRETLIDDINAGNAVLQKAETLAAALRDRLSYYQNLIKTNDPEELLADFNQKMTDINALESQFTQEQWVMGIEGVDSFRSAVQDGSQAGFYEGMGAAVGLLEMGAAKKELKAQKERLNEQRRTEMSRIFWNAIDRTDEQIEEYERLAAYSETDSMQDYYLGLTENLECFKKSMDDNWSSTNSNWLVNNCAVPNKPAEGIENKFIAQDVKYSRLAEAKYEYYLENRVRSFGIGATFETDDFNTVFAEVIPGGPVNIAGIEDGTRVYGIEVVEYEDDFITVIETEPLGNVEKVDFLLSRLKTNLDHLKNIVELEMYEAEKDELETSIEVIEANIKKVTSLKRAELNQEDQEYLNLQFNGLLLTAYSDDYSELRDNYKNYYASTLKTQEEITTPEKFKINNEIADKMGVDYGQSNWKISDEVTINMMYSMFAFTYDLPVDEVSLDHLSENPIFLIDNFKIITNSDEANTLVDQNRKFNFKIVKSDVSSEDIVADPENLYDIIPVEKQYMIEGAVSFREAAISYAAAAVDVNPKAEYYYQLGLYNEEESSVLAFSNMLAAKEMDPGYFTSDRKVKYDDLEARASEEIEEAIKMNDTEYLNAFLNAGLQDNITIEDQDILTFSISLDQPDAVQLILNSYVDGLVQAEIDKLVRKSMIKSAFYNSERTLNRFIELGINPNFEIEGDSPYTVAERYASIDVLDLLYSL